MQEVQYLFLPSSQRHGWIPFWTIVGEEKGKVKVWGVDTLSGKDIEIDADMVVLATAMRPSEGAQDLAKKLQLVETAASP